MSWRLVFPHMYVTWYDSTHHELLSLTFLLTVWTVRRGSFCTVSFGEDKYTHGVTTC
jgi:hypothetical protein